VTAERLVAIPALAAALLLAAIPASVAAASSIVECGQVSAYTAPDPIAPADGSLTVGLLPAWTIAADATLSPAAEANLATVGNGGPTCVGMDLDDGGVITAIDFAAQGDIDGAVVPDSGIGGYVFADRLLVPTEVVEAYPGLAGLFTTSAAAGTDLLITFFIDVATGQFTGFSGHAAFCGAGDLAGNGDGLVGLAAIPVALLDADDTAALGDADLAQVCATVDSEGVVDTENQGQFSVTGEVEISLVPQAPDTSTGASKDAPGPGPSPALLGLLLVGLLVLASTRHRTDRGANV
jgi:MYXO-CTERM domain-containing protein